MTPAWCNVTDDPRCVTIAPLIASKGVDLAELTSRLAASADVPALTVLMNAAIAELQRAFLDDAQIASSRAIIRPELWCRVPR
jgi:hypothetical protein